MRLKTMGKMGRLLLVLVLSAVMAVPSFGAGASLETQMAKTAAYLQQTVTKPTYGSVGGEWTILALARSQAPVEESYWETYEANLAAEVKEKKGVLHGKKYTEYSRVVLALTALGKDPTQVAGYHLLTPLGDYEKTIWQGMNGPIWALLALDSGQYPVPENKEAKTQATRELYVERILSCQLEDGGWSLFGGTESQTEADRLSDADITAMALQALWPYRGEAAVAAAAEKGWMALSKMQGTDGSFSTGGISNVESTVQVLVALSTWGISVEDSRFVKDGQTVLDALLSFANDDGSFVHSETKKGADLMATEQALYGMAAFWRAQQQMTPLYDMSDVKKESGSVNEEASKETPLTEEMKPAFLDVTGEEETAVTALAKAGIIGGMEDGLYHPEGTLTRAQMATVLAKAFQWEAKGNAPFTDCQSHWAASYIAASFEAGVLAGRTETAFDPEGIITREEAAVLLSRAAAKQGLDVERSQAQARNSLSLFEDYGQASAWAWSGLSYCLDTGILKEDSMRLEPKAALSRGEMAQMVYRLMEANNQEVKG